ncbi:hypothetical protein HS1genome_2403 [Sulfodiicoccus acidiphilus]|uniref:tRNA (adenine(58)-N(1))-methyltransferase catalytic subunit TRM61 C-terminal domain-containing protein n=1 Tax=Sulfodiicoccus acidiphilus TaxID=1670455 RepID=A0A348B762_9CREN|nr:tRNA (adenine-N1)-methyltransferase [Sulfodiicoccus acidiphilus]BBD74014.1 hypothetical protein HS1genome_2403 [Sulfodiicoccus acidiphilus]GGT87157.1 hypothetical protein GCM10007116_01510 [Sulfodiicoccus acidiphilus]
MKVSEGEEVLLYVDERRKYLLRVEKGKYLSTDKGKVKCDEIIGLEYGSRLKLSKGEAYVLRPTVADLYRGGLRPSQVIYPKDVSYMIFYSGIGPGSKVVEAGTGSGYLTAALAHFVGDEGKVYSYDVRDDMQRNAEKNLRRLKLSHRVELKRGDVREEITEREVDAVFLDMPDPWNALKSVRVALKPSGHLSVFVPTLRQVELTYLAMGRTGFTDLRADQLILMEIRVKENATRPKNVGVMHTGYVVLGRKVQADISAPGSIEV